MKNRVKKQPSTVMHIIYIIVFLTLGILFLQNTVIITKNYKERINMQTNFVLEYATIVDYKTLLSDGGYYYYYICYEYIAPDNTVYSGYWGGNVYDEEEAKAYIGKKVPIYIDHENHLKSDNPNPKPTIGGAWFCGAMSIICFALTFNSIIRIIRWEIKKRKEE